MLKLNVILQKKANNIPTSNGKNEIVYWLKLSKIKNFLSINSMTIDKTPIIQYFKKSLFCLESIIFKLNIKNEFN